MEIYRARLNKEALQKIPEEERKLFVTIAHLQNEIRFSLYGVVWSHDFTSDIEAETQGQISINFFYLKILAGKLSEGWQLIQNYYNGNKSIAIDFNSNGSKEAISLLNELKRYFSKSNAIHNIRNSLSFHYSPDDLISQLDEAPDKLDMYISKDNDANTLYYFAEVLSNKAALEKLEFPADVNPIEAIIDELTGISKKFNKFNMLYMKYIINKYSPEIWEGTAEPIKMENLTEFSKVRIPMFTDTSNGFI
jgi:hypothetical protein